MADRAPFPYTTHVPMESTNIPTNTSSIEQIPKPSTNSTQTDSSKDGKWPTHVRTEEDFQKCQTILARKSIRRLPYNERHALLKSIGYYEYQHVKYTIYLRKQQLKNAEAPAPLVADALSEAINNVLISREIHAIVTKAASHAATEVAASAPASISTAFTETAAVFASAATDLLAVCWKIYSIAQDAKKNSDTIIAAFDCDDFHELQESLHGMWDSSMNYQPLMDTEEFQDAFDAFGLNTYDACKSMREAVGEVSSAHVPAQFFTELLNSTTALGAALLHASKVLRQLIKATEALGCSINFSIYQIGYNDLNEHSTGL